MFQVHMRFIQGLVWYKFVLKNLLCIMYSRHFKVQISKYGHCTEQSAKNNSWYWENMLMLWADKYLFWPRYNLQFLSYGTPGIFSQMGFLTIWTSKLHKWNYTHYPRLLQYVPIFFQSGSGNSFIVYIYIVKY